MVQRFLSTIVMIKYQEDDVSLIDYILPIDNKSEKKSRVFKTTINIKKRGDLDENSSQHLLRRNT